MAERTEPMNLGALAANVIDLADRKVKPVTVKKAQDQPRLPPREKNYVIGPFRALKDQRINKTAALPVLMAICSFTNRAGETWVGRQTIADIFGVTRQAIDKQVHRLIELGYLEVVQKHGKDYSARLRVIFNPDMTLADVKSAIPTRLQPEIPPEVILSKEEARERLKKIREARIKQPQRLPIDPVDNSNSMQPQKLPNTPPIRQPNEGLEATSVVAHHATSEGCVKGSFKDIEGIPIEVWKKKNEEYGFVRNDARDQHASEVIQTWAIPQHHIGSLLATMLDELRARQVDPPATLMWFADLGEDMVREMCEGLKA